MDGSEYDAIVVGAGPGGSAAAISLAQAGWRVLLLDKATFPRDKVCGDMVSPRSQRVLRELGCLQAVERLCSNRVASGVFYLDGEQFMAAQVPRIEGLTNYGYVIPRLVFDEIIFRQAQAVGVETIERCEVKDVVVDTSGVTLLAQREGKSCSFRGRLVIGADGARSVVAPALRMAATDSKNVTIALRAYY